MTYRVTFFSERTQPFWKTNFEEYCEQITSGDIRDKVLFDETEYFYETDCRELVFTACKVSRVFGAYGYGVEIYTTASEERILAAAELLGIEDKVTLDIKNKYNYVFYEEVYTKVETFKFNLFAFLINSQSLVPVNKEEYQLSEIHKISETGWDELYLEEEINTLFLLYLHVNYPENIPTIPLQDIVTHYINGPSTFCRYILFIRHPELLQKMKEFTEALNQEYTNADLSYSVQLLVKKEI